ncbi:MAG TPA: DinB family protein [Gemmatimonadales bacterium]|nr:DinB family protein [Gemmatimonadales bacterium]
MSTRAGALARRIEEGAATLGALAQSLSDAEWRATVPPDGRTVGVIVHHVASMYPVEVDLARTLASGKPVAGLTWSDIAKVNATHAHDHAPADRQETVALLGRNAKAAADAVRTLSDQELDQAAPVSLNADAPLTAQFFIEGHALSHSWHHLAKIRAALKR